MAHSSLWWRVAASTGDIPPSWLLPIEGVSRYSGICRRLLWRVCTSLSVIVATTASAADIDKLVDIYDNPQAGLTVTIGQKALTHEQYSEVAKLPIVVLQFDRANVPNEGLRRLAPLAPTLRRVSFRRSKLEPLAAETLAVFENLSRLDVGSAGMTDASLEHIGRLVSLTHLDLAGNIAVTDAGVAHLKGLVRLQSIGLLGTAATADSLIHLERCVDLETPGVPSDRWDDVKLQILKPFKKLKHLSLERSRVTDRGLAYVADFNDLEFLNLLGCRRITDVGVLKLRNLHQLTDLDLTETNITSQGLAVVTAMPRLKSLGVLQTRVDDSGLAALAGCHELRSLDLQHTAVKGEGLVHLAGLPKLASLSLGQSPLNDEHLAFLERMPTLGKLAFFSESMRVMAGYGLKAHIVVQSFNDIAEAYGPTNTIIDNCHVLVAFV